MTEGRELPQKDIDYIAKMTDQNNHNQARLHLAQVMRNRHLEKAYQAVITLHLMFNQMNEMMKARVKLDKMLFKQAERKYSNFRDIYGAYEWILKKIIYEAGVVK